MGDDAAAGDSRDLRVMGRGSSLRLINKEFATPFLYPIYSGLAGLERLIW